MKGRKMGGLLAFLLVLGLGVWASAATVSTTETINLKRIEDKVDEILKVQENLLTQFDAVMEELRIVKVRVSR